MSLEREVLPYRTEARQESLRAFRNSEASHPALAFTRGLVAIFGPVADPGAGLDEHVFDVGQFGDLGLCRRIATEEAGITVFVPRTKTSGATFDGRFGKGDFIYDAEANEYRCPAGERLIWRYVKGVVSKDHVHILVSCPPTMAPSEIMRRIKGRTSSKLYEEFPHIKKRYWGRHFWARGYFCATVGQMTEEMIKNYLEHHFEPNPSDDDFRMEPD